MEGKIKIGKKKKKEKRKWIKIENPLLGSIVEPIVLRLGMAPGFSLLSLSFEEKTNSVPIQLLTHTTTSNPPYYISLSTSILLIILHHQRCIILSLLCNCSLLFCSLLFVETKNKDKQWFVLHC
ncbi:hypothetical protein ACOSP7_028976 [Xanthoceras sorbifolium]